ncbi:MAG TPA: AIR synthase related protein, partial [Puia sp.]|nr:AIR synthase related protein [Puia sp.]
MEISEKTAEQLRLTAEEFGLIRQKLGRTPNFTELCAFSAMWSEHCSYKNSIKWLKTLPREGKKMLVAAGEENAGLMDIGGGYGVVFKIESHNHPSAIEPYGGANTGLGGVIRDPLGTGLGAKPICNTDVFCFAPPDFPPEQLPQGVLHPRRVMNGVVAGVRDYGNRMGIPTVNGAILFDERYLANPLVFCGTVGVIPADKAFKQVNPGDLIVAVGGRTGRDGIHGATFSSLELTHESETVSGGAVQIGNAITEK